MVVFVVNMVFVVILIPLSVYQPSKIYPVRVAEGSIDSFPSVPVVKLLILIVPPAGSKVIVYTNCSSDEDSSLFTEAELL